MDSGCQQFEDISIMHVETTHLNGVLEEALNKLREETINGLKHGFFEIHLKGEIIKGHKRRFDIVAGKSFHFIIPEDALQQST